jgi:nucleotide-binding universal stress UspA family protein
MFHVIVVGTDGRAGGCDALDLASRLAIPGESEIVAVRAMPHQAYPGHLGGPHDIGAGAAQARAEFETELRAGDVRVLRRRVMAGSPPRVLHEVAEMEHADLIVVGSSRRGAVGRVLAGDVAASTMHGCPCPVAIAPRGCATDVVQGALRTIGVGFDGSEESLHALRLAAAIARSTGGALHVREVATLPPVLSAGPAFDETWFDTYREEAAAHVRTALAGLEDVDAVGDAVIGVPALELARMADDVDLLVVGSRGRGPLRRVLLGSTAAALSHNSHCAMLVLPRGAAAPEGTATPSRPAEAPA